MVEGDLSGILGTCFLSAEPHVTSGGPAPSGVTVLPADKGAEGEHLDSLPRLQDGGSWVGLHASPGRCSS